LLDDTYNASPSSFFAAIDVLMTFAGRKVLVAGDMKELGAESESAHTCVGTYAAAAGVDELWAVGKMSEFTAQAFGDKGRHFTSKTELVDACKGIAGEDIVFLIKGSRGARMEKVVNDLSTSGGV
jgi:UDP-N-acetylmuramoyl-tripeptide--D-alanyl-D-alanine ligase